MGPIDQRHSTARGVTESARDGGILAFGVSTVDPPRPDVYHSHTSQSAPRGPWSHQRRNRRPVCPHSAGPDGSVFVCCSELRQYLRWWHRPQRIQQLPEQQPAAAPRHIPVGTTRNVISLASTSAAPTWRATISRARRSPTPCLEVPIFP